jgi:hypothetical protein
VTPTETLTVTESPTLTVTVTYSVSPTFTATPTVTPGPGSWSFSPSGGGPLVTGAQNNSAVVNFNNGADVWSSGYGLLTFIFPAGLTAPSVSNFYVQPGNNALVGPYNYSGQSVEVQVRNLAPGATLPFLYGYNSTGFAVNTTVSPLVLGVFAYPQSVTLGAGGAIAQTGAAIIVQTPTATPSITATFTISSTVTETPTITETSTITMTFTETPIAAARDNEVYSYPNPFKMEEFDKVTFRFPNSTEAGLTVFNLVGEPVRQIPASDINAAQGWAIWPGVDDYLRPVSGGLYFVRVKTPSGILVKKFTVIH